MYLSETTIERTVLYLHRASALVHACCPGWDTVGGRTLQDWTTGVTPDPLRWGCEGQSDLVLNVYFICTNGQEFPHNLEDISMKNIFLFLALGEYSAVKVKKWPEGKAIDLPSFCPRCSYPLTGVVILESRGKDVEVCPALLQLILPPPDEERQGKTHPMPPQRWPENPAARQGTVKNHSIIWC